MKILMFGRGVIASLYGWALEKAGHSVEFYVRPGRIAEHGSTLDLRFSDARKKLQGAPVEEIWKMRLREDLPVDHDYELIVLSVQHYRFAEAAAFLGPRASRATVLVFNNFWTEPQAAAAGLPADQLAWGFPMAGGGFDADDVLKGALFSRVQFGTFGTNPTAREAAVRRLFREAGFGIGEQRDFRGWLWIHFVVNAGLLSQVLKAGSFPRLMGSADQMKDVILSVRELLPLVTARGIDLEKHFADVALFRLPAWIAGMAFKMALKLSTPLRLVVESHTNQEELRSICRDVLAEARRLGIAVPRLEALEPFFSKEPD